MCMQRAQPKRKWRDHGKQSECIWFQLEQIRGCAEIGMLKSSQGPQQQERGALAIWSLFMHRAFAPCTLLSTGI